MSNPLQADAQSVCARREQRRQRRRFRRVSRVFEGVAALIPGVVLLLHLTLKSSGVSAEAPSARGPSVLPQSGSLAVTQQLTVVPEPNAAVLLGLGFGTLFYRRRHKPIGAGGTNAPIVS